MRHIRLMRAIRESLAEASGPSDDTDTADEEANRTSDSEIEVEETEEDLKAIGIRIMKEIQEMMGIKGTENVEDAHPTQPQTPHHEGGKDSDNEKEGETHIPTAEI